MIPAWINILALSTLFSWLVFYLLRLPRRILIPILWVTVSTIAILSILAYFTNYPHFDYLIATTGGIALGILVIVDPGRLFYRMAH